MPNFSKSRTAVAAIAGLATISGSIAVAPTASAWETNYSADEKKCTISFSSSEQEKLNTAWSTLFAAMAEKTNNETLKYSFEQASKNEVLPEPTVKVTPQEAQANGGFYGLDIYDLVLPYGIDKAIDNIGVDEVVANIDYDAALAQVDLTNVAKVIDWDKALDKDGDGNADVDTKAAVKALPLKEVVKNVDWSSVKSNVSTLELLAIYRNPSANLPRIMDKLDTDQLLSDALAKTDIDKEQTAKDVIKASGVDPDQVVRNVTKQPAVRAAAKNELQKIDYKKLIMDALQKAGKEPSAELVLGYSPSEVVSAASAAFKEVGPAVTAPIVTARPAFTSCAAPADGSNGNAATGSVVSGSSNLDLKGLAVVSVLGLVAALIASGVIGFAVRPAFDQFVAQMQQQ